MNRIYYLDHLRAFAMVFGILLHVTTVADFGWLEIIGLISNNFRMGTFFAVSGFFAGLLLSRRKKSVFLLSRIMALGIPLLFGLIILNPLTLWLIYNWRIGPAGLETLFDLFIVSTNADNDVKGIFVWHLHLWFLISLLCYTLVAPLVSRVVSSPLAARVFKPAFEKIPNFLMPIAIAVIVSGTVIGFRVFFLFVLEPLGASWIVRATLTYSPYYILGLVLFGCPRLWNYLHRFDLLLISFAILLWLLPSYQGHLGSVLDILQREVTVCASLFALLGLFRKFWARPNSVGRVLSEGIYTAYLFHYMIIYIIAFLFLYLLPNGSPVQFFVISITVLLVALGIHKLVVRSNLDVLRLLVNGRRN